MAGTGAALFSLYYHVARLRGELPDGGKGAYRSWDQKVRRAAGQEFRLPPRERILNRILPLEAAAARFDPRTLGRGPEPRDLFRRSLTPRQTSLRQHLATAKLLEGYLLGRSASPHGLGASWSHVAETYSTLLRQVAPQLRVDRAEHGVLGGPVESLVVTAEKRAVSEVFSGLNYEATVSVDPCGKSSVVGSGTVTNNVPISTYSQLADPCGWSTTIPSVFQVSYPTADDALPDVEDTPTPSPPHTLGQDYTGNFYEVVGLDLFDDEITQFRNILNIVFTSSQATGPQITLNYSLFESLTSEVLGFEAQAGIDADSGYASVQVSPDPGGLNQVTMAGSKGIRFSAAAPFHEEMNLISVPWLEMFMAMAIVGGLTV